MRRHNYQIHRKLKLYRFYANGIRVTIEARSETEAKSRFSDIKRARAKDIKRGNKTMPRPHGRNAIRADSLAIMNAHDIGYTFGAVGHVAVPRRVMAAFATSAEQRAARNGMAVGNVENRNLKGN